VSVVGRYEGHNEEACGADPIRSPWRQTRTPDTVDADNGTDGKGPGLPNRGKSMREGWRAQLGPEKGLPGLRGHDQMLVIDAGSLLDEEFVDCGLLSLRALQGGLVEA
jgi:hypothetical protein